MEGNFKADKDIETNKDAKIDRIFNWLPRSTRILESKDLSFTEEQLGPRGGRKGKKVHICEYPNCGKVYIRREHRLRHEKSHNLTESENFCESCKEKLSRGDTYEQHLSSKKHHEHLHGSPPSYMPTLEKGIPQGKQLSLIRYARIGSIKSIKELLDTNHDLNLEFRDSQGQTALSLAAQYGHGKIISYLLHSGQRRADINSQDTTGRTPLSHAVEKGFLDIVTFLITQKGVDINVRDTQDRTPLTWARLGGHKAIAKRLIDAGALESNVDTFTDSGYASRAIDEDEPCRPSAIDDDSHTVYSLSSLSGMEKSKLDYQLAFVSELIKSLRSSLIYGEFPSHASPEISSLFRTFAVKLGYGAEQKVEFDAMQFVARYRNEIVQMLQEQWGSQERIMSRLKDDEMDKEERIRFWLAHQKEYTGSLDPQERAYLSNQLDSGHLDDIECMHSYEDGPSINIEFVTRTSAYTWLTEKLTNLLRLSIPVSKPTTAIHERIKDCFPSIARISRQTARLEHTMSFNIDWPLLELLSAYYYDGGQSVEDILRNYVTLTSDGVHTQALTATQYLHQNWPESGVQILDLVTRLVETREASLVISDTTIVARIVSSQLQFQVTGLVDSICEVADQLIWMGAAFRPSPVKDAVFESNPSIQNVKRANSESSHLVSTNQESQHYSCEITYNMVFVSPESMPGGCWHGLFRYAVIAQGFPIARRTESTQGLEMSLGMILALCQAQHIGEFDNQIVIKGFSSMCYLAYHQQGTSVWHFTGSGDGQYFSCMNVNFNDQSPSIGIHEITEDRHFVGWSSDASYGIGALDSNYRIQSTKLPLPYPGCLLHNRSLRRGRRYPVETVCIPDSKNDPRTVERSFHERMKQLHIRPIVLWDTDGQRGWLTNGTSALLHLVLMSVENDGSLFNSEYCLRKDDVRQRKSKLQFENAAHILLDKRNWELPILDDGGQIFNFRHRVEDLYFLLDLAIETQIMSIAKNKAMPSTSLEGWDFMDMAGMAHDPIKSRFYALEKDCRGWMNFLRDTNAVTLFGNDFGELFKPKADFCRFWKTLPQQHCYLAANVGDLIWFAENYHGNTGVPLQKLSENTVWPAVPKVLQQCICLGSSSENSEHSDFVQVLLPETAYTTKKDTQSTVDPISGDDFVIFGEVRESSRLRSSHSSPPPVDTTTDSTDSIANGIDSDLHDSASSETVPSLAMAKSSSLRTLQPVEYRVAIVCALEEEFKAIRCLFDEEFDDPVFNENDNTSNGYVFGRMASHNIVAACLPGIYGTASAAHLVTKLICSFQKVDFCLMVGIGGGMPSEKNDIRLGDVVVSCPRGAKPGAIKHDFLRIVENGKSELLGYLRDPPDRLLSAIMKIRSSPNKQIHALQQYLDTISKDHPEYCYPGIDMDILYATPCSFTEMEKIVMQRPKRYSTQPDVHYGLIVTGDSLVKDAKTRDKLAQEHGALCFEMEAAGVLNVIPSLIIRGICDYSDSHKNDSWHEYASATAAAYAKFLLTRVKA